MRFLMLFLLGFICLAPFQDTIGATSGDKTVVVEGLGASKQDALLQAKRNAVEEGIGVILISETEVANFTLQKDRVITQAVGAVRSYSLLKEEQQQDSYYVKIRAVVSLDKITSDLMALKILLISMDKPRTMVLITEENSNRAATSVIDFLKGKGFDIVDPSQTAALLKKDDAFIRKAAAGDPVAAAKLGAENGAEYIIVGDVRKSTLQNDMLKSAGMTSGQATLTLKVVNCSNGKVVATKSGTGAAAHISPEIARENASTKAAGKLMDQQLFEAIVSSFQDSINNGADYEVSVVGVKSYRLQKKTSELFNDVQGVVSVVKRSYSGGKLELSVQFKGSVDTLCDKIDSREFSGNRLLVTDVIGNRVVVQIEKI